MVTPSDDPESAKRGKKKPVNFVIIEELLALRVPFQRALQLQRDAAQQHRADGAMRGFDVADRALPGAHAIEEISRVTVAVIRPRADRKSTRLNSSHLGISYAVFCLKKKKRSYNTSVGYDWRVKRQRALSDKSALEHAIDSV